VTSTTPVAYVVAFVAVAARNLCSSTPTALTPASRAGSFTSGVPYASTALHAVDQPTPNSAATAAVDRLPRPTCSHAHRRARSVSTARGAIWWMRLRPAAHRALLLRAPPQPLAPHQRDRPAPRRQIPHQHRAAALRLGHHPALRAALDPGPQLDQQFDLPADLPRGQHLKVGKTHKDSARPRPLATLTYQLGPPPIRSFSLRIVKAPASSQPQAQDRVARSKPLIIVKNPYTGH